MSIYQMLKDDHKSVRGLLHDIARSRLNVGQKFSDMRNELQVHMAGEEQYLYPVLRETDRYREQALEALEEHHAAQLLLGELNAAQSRDDQWFAKLQVFTEILDHHIEEEESKIFKAMKRTLSSQQEMDMQIRIETLKKECLAGVH